MRAPSAARWSGLGPAQDSAPRRARETRAMSSAAPSDLPPRGAPPLFVWWLLAAIPVAASVYRVVNLATDAAPGPDDARFHAAPISAVLHVVGASIFAVLGALQLVPRWRTRPAKLHRRLGWLVAVGGLVGTIAGLWMTLTYPLPDHDHVLIKPMRFVVGLAIVGFLALGLRAGRARAWRAHGEWMFRAYVLAMGAGTQSVVLGPMVALSGKPSPAASVTLMGACWLVNALLAEAWISLGRGFVSGPRTA